MWMMHSTVRLHGPTHGERYIQIHATHQIASRVEVSVDKTRHGEEPFGIDNTQIPLAFRRTDIRFNCLDL